MTVPEAWFWQVSQTYGQPSGFFGALKVAKVLELIVFLHVIKNGFALPMGGFEFAVFGALFGDLDFAVCLP